MQRTDSFMSPLIKYNIFILTLVLGTFTLVYYFLNHQLDYNQEERRNIAQIRLSTEHVAAHLFQSAMLHDNTHLAEAALASNEVQSKLQKLSVLGRDTSMLKQYYLDFFRFNVITASLALENRNEDALVANELSHRKYHHLIENLNEIMITIDEEQFRIIQTMNGMMVLSVILLVAAVIFNSKLLLRSFARIRSQEIEHSEMISALGDGVYGVDEKSLCIFMNSAALKMIQYSAHEVIGKNQHLLFHHTHPSGERYKDADCPIFKTLHDHQTRHVEETFIRKDGLFLPISLTVAPLGETKAIVVFQDISVKKQHEKELYIQANYDLLTGLPNRRLFTILSEQLIATAIRENQKFAVAFLDLDGFKAINDFYGHDVGDLLLQETANRFRSVLRQSDIIARFGGDEFVIFLSFFSDDTMPVNTMERLIEKINKPILINNIELHVGVSIGYTLYPDDSSEIDLLIRHADSAMYDAKQNGKGRIRRYMLH